MTRRCNLLIWVLSSYLCAWHAHAYEIDTHGAITYEAYQRSVLTDPLLLLDLGIENAPDAFGETYFSLLTAKRAP